MGYETMLLIGINTKQVFEEYTYFKVTATLDMGKISRSHILLLPWQNETPSVEKWEYFSPAGDGDTPVHEDRYGVLARPIPIDAVIKALEKDIRRDNYRPAGWALTLLNKMNDDSITDETYSVMLFGH